MALTACANEPTDAMMNECEAIFSCVSDCTNPPPDSGVEAGTQSDCETVCVSVHSTQAQNDYSSLLTCAGSPSCSAACQ